MVYVLSMEGKPLMPCTNVIARLLLKEGKAKVKSHMPFTIKMTRPTKGHIQKLVHGLDTGSDRIGSAVVGENGDVVYAAEVQVRNDISKKMKRRAEYRKNRRGRKTRYRPVRYANRKNSTRVGRFSPTMVSKLNSHIKEIKFVGSILPISQLVLETANFDTHALKNPDVLKDTSLYQKGINYGFANTKAYVLHRDGHSCQNCKAKKGRMEVHHIVYRSNGGSDEETNLITLCKPCHDSVHDGTLILKKSGKKKGNLKHATQMNCICKQLPIIFPQAIETFGFVTKEHRQKQGLDKRHYNDAISIASNGDKIRFRTHDVFFKKSIHKGDYRLRNGVRSERVMPTGKLFGFRTFDKVLYNKKIYFIKGRQSTGYAYLMDINGVKIGLKPIPKFSKMSRISARKTVLIHSTII